MIELLYKIGFKKKNRLRVLFIINRKGISKIGVYVAKKKIKGSIERNFIKRRIRIAYKVFIKQIEFLKTPLLILLSWEEKGIPSYKILESYMKRIFHYIMTQAPNLISYKP